MMSPPLRLWRRSADGDRRLQQPQLSRRVPAQRGVCVDHQELTWEPPAALLHVSPWDITSDEFFRIQSKQLLVFLLSTFHLLGDSGCQNDYLEIREGNSSGALVGRFCGNLLPSNYTSVIGHVLWVKFVSDASMSGAGFRATFSHCECLSLSFIPCNLPNIWA